MATRTATGKEIPEEDVVSQLLHLHAIMQVKSVEIPHYMHICFGIDITQDSAHTDCKKLVAQGLLIQKPDRYEITKHGRVKIAEQKEQQRVHVGTLAHTLR